jgi:glycerophosphoryl diester phosphodiesterase
MLPLEALTARPIAHRGLHDGVVLIENTASAFTAAIDQHYGIECDLQISRDGEAMVHHDSELGRVAAGEGRLSELTAAELKRIPFRACADRMLTLGELCDLAAGRSVLLVELKSRFNGDRRLVQRTADVLSGYRGAAAVMSFDPAQMATLREIAPNQLRGLTAESSIPGRSDGVLDRLRRTSIYVEDALRMRPQFIAYSVDDLPSKMMTMARKLFAVPILAWTVRNPGARQKAEQYADQIIFEGFAA